MPNVLLKPWQLATASWQQANGLQRIGLMLTVLSFFFLYPGVTEPIMTIKASINMFGLKSTIFEETRSIWQTVLSLKEAGYAEVGFMVVTFSIIIPVTKGLLIIWTWLSPARWRWQLISVISKWSMADVFVVAILVAFFTAKATADLQSALHDGFYWFLAYCFLSIISGQCLAGYADQQLKK
ncbi:MAG: paraquat-inducible protein A [Oleispira antarctica]|uniref:Paraquat-inducible protein A n=1 Tax=Oleispira antarctica RB-8 TaxID=698738 RepID=R4YSM2_OLEAN|nr:paraquat-inducible protein A [Oleispira antarctica]MBQ0794287.1 paraquat-inducible protein A [Oleispira antarctica]CCK75144.1 Paraquat-inducible protein A [Oleispira antarctica RB-8]|tara:strand:- start:1129 stop:1674 length:546 start_codon:yes stop_codon:yes gene_type:complete